MEKIKIENILQVPSDANPANVNSKIFEISNLENLWLYGPPILLESWNLKALRQMSAEKLKSEMLPTDLEVKTKKCLITKMGTTVKSGQWRKLIENMSCKFNNFSNIIRIMAYILRFIYFSTMHITMNKEARILIYQVTILYDKIQRLSGCPRKV